MPATAVPAALRADKALVRQIADFDDRVENAEDFIELMKTSAAKTPVQKEVVALRKRMNAALESSDKTAVAKTVATLVKEADKLADDARDAMLKEYNDRFTSQWTKARGLLAQALVEVGAIEPLALRMPVQKQQAELRAQLDRIEAQAPSLDKIKAMEDLAPKVEAFVKRLGGIAKSGDWMRTAYLPLLARVQAAIKGIPVDRCRKTLLAELDFVEVVTNKALLKADTKAVQAGPVPRLQRIEKLAAQVVAASPAIDRELVRLARLAAGLPASSGPGRKLKAMAQAKASTWPAGADADGIESALGAFEADLGKLAAELDKSARTSAKA